MRHGVAGYKLEEPLLKALRVNLFVSSLSMNGLQRPGKSLSPKTR